mmetsp:Transcript_3077/g.8325  ORF Transcript_3077/g.8325 Transcript_3077/m.8325 type:complete len:211 (+) Transcript_3077:1054-1686(+)
MSQHRHVGLPDLPEFLLHWWRVVAQRHHVKGLVPVHVTTAIGQLRDKPPSLVRGAPVGGVDGVTAAPSPAAPFKDHQVVGPRVDDAGDLLRRGARADPGEVLEVHIVVKLNPRGHPPSIFPAQRLQLADVLFQPAPGMRQQRTNCPGREQRPRSNCEGMEQMPRWERDGSTCHSRSQQHCGAQAAALWVDVLAAPHRSEMNGRSRTSEVL